MQQLVNEQVNTSIIPATFSTALPCETSQKRKKEKLNLSRRSTPHPRLTQDPVSSTTTPIINSSQEIRTCMHRIPFHWPGGKIRSRYVVRSCVRLSAHQHAQPPTTTVPTGPSAGAHDYDPWAGSYICKRTSQQARQHMVEVWMTASFFVPAPSHQRCWRCSRCSCPTIWTTPHCPQPAHLQPRPVA
jgi:hypothetical protein